MKDDRVYLLHIMDAIRKIESYSEAGRDEFFSVSHWQDAIIRQLEIIGEAAKHLSDDLRAQHNNVPWRRICGLRDVLIHDYMGVDLNAVWEVSGSSIPTLKAEVEKILAEDRDGQI